MRSLRDSDAELGAFDVAVYMVSVDDPAENRRFAESLDASFPILSDPDRQVARAYGVAADDTSYAQRLTFFIDRQGIVRHVDRDVNPAEHGPAIARKLQELGFPKR